MVRCPPACPSPAAVILDLSEPWGGHSWCVDRCWATPRSSGPFLQPSLGLLIFMILLGIRFKNFLFILWRVLPCPTVPKRPCGLCSCLGVTLAMWLSHCGQVTPCVPFVSSAEVVLHKNDMVNTSQENLGVSLACH